MTNCAACRKEFKRQKGQKHVSCIYCKSEFHRSCNSDFIVNTENDTDVNVICKPCIVEKINKGSEETKRADKLEKSIAVLTKQVEDLTTRLSELCKSNPPNNSSSNSNSSSNPNFSMDLIENKILEAIHEQKQQERLKLNLFVRGMKSSDDDKRRFVQLCVSELNLSEAEAKEIKMTKRVGPASENNPQPMLVILTSAQIRRKILKNAPNLRRFSDEKIFIAPDFTKKQLEANKVVYSEFKHRKSNGENVKIFRNKVIQITSPSAPNPSPPSFHTSTSQSPSLQPSPSNE